MTDKECINCHELKSVGVEEDGKWICEDCDGPECECCGESLLNSGCGKYVNRGCCNNGACGHGIEALCGECGTWDEEDEVYRCPDCQEKHENKKHYVIRIGLASRVVPRFNFSYADGDERGCDIYGQWWVMYRPDNGIWSWDYKKEESHEENK